MREGLDGSARDSVWPGEPVGGIPQDSGGEEGVVGSVLHGDAVVVGIGAFGLHPLGDGDPGLAQVNAGDAEISEAGPSLGNEDSLGIADDTKPFGVDAGDEERGSMAEDVVVALGFSGVNEEKSVTVGDPVLLCVVVAQVLPIVEAPLAGLCVVESVV